MKIDLTTIITTIIVIKILDLTIIILNFGETKSNFISVHQFHLINQDCDINHTIGYNYLNYYYIVIDLDQVKHFKINQTYFTIN